MKNRVCYLEENMFFGRDAKGKNIIIYAFEPLKVVDYDNVYAAVKKCGKGNKRIFGLQLKHLNWQG